MCLTVWDWRVLRAEPRLSRWPDLFFLFVSYYFIFFVSSMALLCVVGVFGLIEYSHFLPTLHCWLNFNNKNKYIFLIFIFLPFTGIFANDHVPYEYLKRELALDLPTLSEMTEAAINVLSRGSEGFVLLVSVNKYRQCQYPCHGQILMVVTMSWADTKNYLRFPVPSGDRFHHHEYYSSVLIVSLRTPMFGFSI